VDVEELPISGAWVFTPQLHGDDRGLFLEWYQASLMERVAGHPLALVQANHSVSRQGTLRGVHFTDLPGQAKYVYCPRGSVVDVVVDIRVGSPTYGAHATIMLDSVHRRAVYISEGLGHAFVALTDDAHVTYLCSSGYNPGADHAVNPLDPELGIDWPGGVRLLSEKDAAAPSLAAAAGAGALPSYADCVRLYGSLRSGDRGGQ
jgi:dTDP-4-dehydrorhamnose 3,5-epimerase